VRRGALAEDAVSVRFARARGVSETALRRQMALVATPRVRRFVFVRRVRLRAAPERVGQAMAAALAQLAEDGRAEVLSFPDFAAVAVACARAALTGGLGGWHWRTLALPRLAGPGEAIATLLAAHPLEAGSAVAALAAQGLLGPVWRDLAPAQALRLSYAVTEATGAALPEWPEADVTAPVPTAASPLLDRAMALWAPVLAPLPPRHEAVRTAALLALLRWSPRLLHTDPERVWPALLARLHTPSGAGTPAAEPRADRRADATPGARAASVVEAASEAPQPDAGSVPFTSPDSAPTPNLPAAEDAPDEAVPHGEHIATAWAGVLFLINSLRRLDIDARLDALGAAAPSGWRVLGDLGRALGLPDDEPIAAFLAAQDLDTTTPPALLADLLAGLEALYATNGPWPLPLAQAGVLHASETHLDLDLGGTSVDIAVRLAGLDLDPGWVPWLGRVVMFHYNLLPNHVRGPV
jgi:hypothetical protein